MTDEDERKRYILSLNWWPLVAAILTGIFGGAAAYTRLQDDTTRIEKLELIEEAAAARTAKLEQRAEDNGATLDRIERKIDSRWGEK